MGDTGALHPAAFIDRTDSDRLGVLHPSFESRRDRVDGYMFWALQVVRYMKSRRCNSTCTRNFSRNASLPVSRHILLPGKPLSRGPVYKITYQPLLQIRDKEGNIPLETRSITVENVLVSGVGS